MLEMKKVVIEKKPCAICGKKFQPTNRIQRYCTVMCRRVAAQRVAEQLKANPEVVAVEKKVNRYKEVHEKARRFAGAK